MGNPNSVVLENTPLLDRYAELVRIGQDLNEDLTTVEAFFAKLCLHITAIIDVQDFLMLAIYQPQTQTLDRYIYEQGTYRNSNDPIDERCQQILTTKQPLRISGSLPQQAGQKSAIYLPLLWGDTALGVLAVQNARLNVYTDEDVQVLQLLANHVALAITWIDLFRSLQQLSMTGQLLTQQLTTDLLLPKIAEEIKTATKADLVALYPYHQGSNQFRLPPTLGGTLLAPDALQPTILTPDAIPALAVQLTTAKFIPDSQELYAQMGGKSAHYIPSFVNHEQICSTAVVPLRIHAEAVGVMFVNFRHPQRFNAPQRELIQGLASYAAIAMRNSREFDAVAQRRAEELHILQEVDRQISATLDLEKVLQVLVELTAQYIHADDGCVLLYNQRLHRLEAKAAVGYSTQINLKQIIPLDGNKGITRWVFEHRASVLVHDFSQEPAWDAVRVIVDRQTRSELDIPLTDREGNCIGVMNFESRRVGAFTPENRQFLEILAGQAVLAIQNAQTYEREKRLAEDREALITIAREIVRQPDSPQTFEIILEKALALTGAEIGVLFLYDRERDDFAVAAQRGVIPERQHRRLRRGEGIVSWLLDQWQQHGQISVNVGDVTAEPWKNFYETYILAVRSQLTVLLLENNELRGVLNVESPTLNNFSERDETLLCAFADLVVIALQNAERFQSAIARRQQLQTLHEIDIEIISQPDDPDQVMRLIVESVWRLVNTADFVELFLYDAGAFATIYATYRDEQGQPLAVTKHTTTDDGRRELGIVVHVANTKTSYRTQTPARKDPHYAMGQSFADKSSVESEVAVPLVRNKGTVIGVLNLESKRPYAFTDNDIEILEGLAGQAVIAIQNADNNARAQRRLRRFTLLLEASEKLSLMTELDQLQQVYNIIIQMVQEHSQGRSIIRRYDEAAQELVTAAFSQPRVQPPAARMGLDVGAAGQAASERRTIVIDHTENLPAGVRYRRVEPSTHSLVVTPLLCENRLYGTLSVSHDQPKHFQLADVNLIIGLAQQLALTIHRLETTDARKEAERRAGEAELFASMGESAFLLTHRLGNDLGLVRTYVNEIRLLLQEQGRKVDQALQTEFDHILTDVGKVLKVSADLKQQLGALGEGVAKSTVAVSTLLEAIATQLPPIPEPIKLHKEPFSGEAKVDVVVGQIGSIIHNLVSNAIEAMPNGGAITLRTKVDSQAVEIEVSDTGPGIDASDQNKIFNLFYSTKETSGFGLWNARRRALEHGGNLTVHSQPSHGATFHLTLPRSDVVR